MFEKGKSYTYEEIEKILNEVRVSVIEELEHDANEKLSSNFSAMMFKMQVMLVLGLYQTRLLCEEEK